MLQRTFFLITVLLFAASMFRPLFAQEEKTDEKLKLDDRARQRIERQMKELIAAVKPNDEQAAKILAIYEQDAVNSGRRSDRSQRQSLSREKRMEMMQQSREQREKLNKEIEKLLDADQVKKIKAYLAKQRNRRTRRGNE